MRIKQLLGFAITFSLALGLFGQDTKSKKIPSLTTKVAGLQAFKGYFDFYWEEASGKVLLEVENLEEEFLYVNSLAAGVGSNDIGLDRTQLGNTRVVKFKKSGPKILLIQSNYSYRAVSNNVAERKSVEEAFAQSVIWGFEVIAQEGNRYLIDMTKFLLRDAHGVAQRLKMRKQGNYKVDASRSAIYLDNTKSFPLNSEFEALITLTGTSTGSLIRSVTPSSDAVTVRQHHSFISLPDDDYKPRVFDPRSGYFPLMYNDYATPIDQPLEKRFIRRHRLAKKYPGQEISEPIEPIIYYLDRGAPEPVRSALLEGASWWDQAFEAAGYKNAFQVKILPEDADPMDVRYNVINWVHRSTRGWSYGSSISDPRTGEILKGHVQLGSLRVRQDFLIAQGLISAYQEGEDVDPRLLEMALARLRQLSAHEVGHTLGLAHNFAASYNDRSSVMDYPHPYIQLDASGQLDFSEAYDTGIGEWDKRTIIYGYSDFPEQVNEEEALKTIIDKNIKMGLLYLSDADGRPVSSAHPYTHLWDNGKSPIAELNRLSKVREVALTNFSPDNIPVGSPMASLENVLVPLYLAHRYQVEAVAKIIGGVQYTYAVRGDGQITNKIIEDKLQRQALNALLGTLHPSFLEMPESVVAIIPPQPTSYSRGRELFKTHTGSVFDPLGAAESSAAHTMRFLLNPERLTRLINQYARAGEKSRLDIKELFDLIEETVEAKGTYSQKEREIAYMTEKLFVNKLIELASNEQVHQQVRGYADLELFYIKNKIDRRTPIRDDVLAHYRYLETQIAAFRNWPERVKVPQAPKMPDGSPIGCGGFH